MRILMTGGTGLIGRRLIPALAASGHEISVLTRSPRRAKIKQDLPCRWVEGNPSQSGPWQSLISQSEAVINLAGEPVFGGRWSPRRKHSILTSRVQTTNNLVAGLMADNLPTTDFRFISASAIGYYGSAAAEVVLDEQSPPGQGFLSEVCQGWELPLQKLAKTPAVKTTVVRIGVVLDPSGGALGTMLPIFRLGMGGRLGTGQQIVAWVDYRDLVKMIEWLLVHPNPAPVYNATAPKALPQAEFAQQLAHQLHRPAWLPTFEWMLRLVWGEAAAMVLEGARVYPGQALKDGFQFSYPDLSESLSTLLSPKSPRA